MKYAIVPYPIPEILIKSGLIAQTQGSARKNNSSNQCIVSYAPSFNKIFSSYPNFEDNKALITFLSKNPREWDVEFVNIQNVNLSGISEVVSKEASGISHSIPTHDFSDRTTWYCMSIRVESEVLTIDNGLVYGMQNINIIDLTHGKVTRENSICETYGLQVYDDGVEIDNTNYITDYNLGKVTLSSVPAGEITASYSYENGSSFIIEPKAGTVYKVKDAEIQFTQDLIMKPTEFELWVYNQEFDSQSPISESNPLRTKIAEQSDVYKSYKDIINIAKSGTGKIANISGFKNDIMVFPFHYDRVIELYDKYGMQIRVRLVDETPMAGEWGTMTFYCIEEQA